MKRFFIGICGCLLCAFLIACAVQKDSGPVYGEEVLARAKSGETVFLGRSFEIDLNGDGKTEQVRMECSDSINQEGAKFNYTIFINDTECFSGTRVKAYKVDNSEVGLSLLTLDGEHLALSLVVYNPIVPGTVFLVYNGNMVEYFLLGNGSLIGYDTEKEGVQISESVDVLEGAVYSRVYHYEEGQEYLIPEEGYFEYEPIYKNSYKLKKSCYVYTEYGEEGEPILLPAGTEFIPVGGDAGEWVKIQVEGMENGYWMYLRGYTGLIGEDGVEGEDIDFIEDLSEHAG